MDRGTRVDMSFESARKEFKSLAISLMRRFLRETVDKKVLEFKSFPIHLNRPNPPAHTLNNERGPRKCICAVHHLLQIQTQIQRQTQIQIQIQTQIQIIKDINRCHNIKSRI